MIPEKSRAKKPLKTLNRLDAYMEASKNLKELYQTEAGKKFIHHLIYAFTLDNIYYILISKKPLTDCLTHSVIYPVHTKDHPCTDESVFTKFKELEQYGEEEKPAKEVEFNEYLVKYVESNPYDRIACRSAHTNKMLGVDELQALIDFIQDQVNEDNKIILKMIRYARMKNQPEKPKKEKSVKQSKKSNKVKQSNKPKQVQTAKVVYVGGNSSASLGSDSEFGNILETYKKSLK